MVVWASFLRRVAVPDYEGPIDVPEDREGGFFELYRSPKDRRSQRVVLLAPGLQGGYRSKPVRGMVRALNAANFDVFVWAYRDTGDEFTDERSTYSGYGLSDLGRAVDWLAALRDEEGEGYDSISLVGVSLGGNIVLQYLDRPSAERPTTPVDKIVAISPPIDFAAAVEHWSQALMGRLFVSPLSVVNMWLKARAKRKKNVKRGRGDDAHPSKDEVKAYWVRAYWRLRSVAEADHLVNTDLNGIDGAVEYWAKASTTKTLWPRKSVDPDRPPGIPTMIISARDDFLLDSKSYPTSDAIDGSITLVLPENGSHVGFVPRGWNKKYYWSEVRTIEFLSG